MRLMRVLAIAAIATTSAYGTAEAQSSSSARIPAEFPPASYTGRQYVDSRGCVFIRAGIDGQVTWVPRVTRNRKTICGFKPSLPTATAQAAPQARQPAPAQQPEIITVPQQTTTAPAPKPKAAPAKTKTVRKTVPQPKTKIVTNPKVATKPVVAAPAPKVVTTKPVKKVAPAKTKRVVRSAQAPVRGQSACQGASAVSQQYLRSRDNMAVRCGPQASAPSSVITGGGGTGTTTRIVRAAPATSPQPVIRTTNTRRVATTARPVATQTTRVAPRRVYERQLSSTDGIFVPEGYKPVWDDDRLNTRRAHQTFEGKAQMDLAWTRTVPRILIDRRTGREVTYKYPGLQYPYTSFAQQRAAGVTVSTRGRVVQDPIRVVRNRDGEIVRVAPRTTTKRKVKVVTRATSTPTVSTRSRAKTPEAVVKKAATHRYVQAGMFGSPANAKRAAQQIANSGLPARMGNVKRNGKSYTLVLAGPFQTQEQLQSALSQVRRAGFSDAFLRK